MPLSLSEADHLSELALSSARRMGAVICVAVLDDCGDLVRLTRMDGAVPASVEVAQAKAATSRLLRSPTSALTHLTTSLAAAFSRPIALLGGGAPLGAGSEFAGAVGISGASEAQDAQIGDELARAFADRHHGNERKTDG